MSTYHCIVALIDETENIMHCLSQYAFEIIPLFEEDGGGFLISFADFNVCISDGETIEEAIHNGLDALQETIAALESMGLPVPESGSGGRSARCVDCESG